jgi:subtilase family serine protease
MFRRTTTLLGGLLAVLVTLALPATAAPPPAANFGLSHHPVCGAVPTGFARCHSDVVDAGKTAPNSTAPTGLSPQQIGSFYGFSTSSSAGAGKTIAIVDAYDDPSAANDLAVFSSAFGLPACTTSNGCFTKVNQTGGTRYPRANSGWALEISLDIQWAHAIAPGARIVLVEASSNSFTNLLAAEDYAKTHANYVSNSWGGSEFSSENSYDSHFVQSGVSFFASAGDSGLPAQYPSASPNVISVGGTTLNCNGGSGCNATSTTLNAAPNGETGWASSGGGCSAYETPTSAQAGFSQYTQVNCAGKRATPDVALDADPASGVAVYDATSYLGTTGWFTVGGTSASSPMWAARSADAGGTSIITVNAAYVYSSNITYRDPTIGNNGAQCLIGYDLVTGRGTWTGTTP